MKKIILPLSLMLSASLATLPSYAASSFTAEQSQEIGEIAAKYLAENPEFLIQASQKLQQQQLEQQSTQQKVAAISLKNELLNDSKTPFTGPESATVNVIEFFDYQCIYCSHVAPEVEKLQEQYPNVRFIFKETPIFGSRWEPSKYAAQMGLSIFEQKGSVAYKTYHDGVYKTGLNEGNLTKVAVDEQAKAAGMDIAKFKADEYYQKNTALFSQLGFKGTPAFVVMPTENQTVDNVYIINGADVQSLTNAVKALSK